MRNFSRKSRRQLPFPRTFRKGFFLNVLSRGMLYCAFGCALLVLLVLYFRSRFWSRQPIRHFYERASELVIPPQWSKYCDPSVHTFSFNEENVDAVVEYIVAYAPGYLSSKHVRGYLPGSTISVVADQGIQGVIVSRPVDFVLDAIPQKAVVHEYWLGSNSLLASHEFNRPVSAGFFIKDAPIFSVVSISHYPVFQIQTSRYRNYNVECTKLSIGNVLTVRELCKSFKCSIVPTLERLIHLMESRLLSIYTRKGCMFVFRNTMHVEKTKSVMDLVGTVAKNADDAYRAFSTLVFSFRDNYGYVRIHGNSHSAAINRKEVSSTTHRYVYAYNYYAPRIDAGEFFMV